ncbi:SET and MYND domain-containing protein 4-like [Trichogramma pretiosum]|uniref:SET and MYND domain-containing protein 4-like n=1 Tax=Trichogramma pretiosum TaxID=7493 RepID=UPI0006C93F91|nr:SET and MYND domain-containing protein 4-like [Trichogramma pretiosum]
MKLEKERISRELLSDKTKELWQAEDSLPPAKNAELSQSLRRQGNDLYVKVQTSVNELKQEEIYRLYSASIAQAPPDSDDLALAYGNRSALLLLMKKYKECCGDIDRALGISKVDSYKIKLLCRKIECLTAQGLPGSKHLYSDAQALMSKVTEEDKDYGTLVKLMEKAKVSSRSHVKSEEIKKEDVVPKHMKILMQKERENPFDTVTIRQDKKYGRYLVAGRDLEAGEIVCVEKPYVKVVNANNAHMYCSHCLALSWATVPCDNCSLFMFCSDRCKAEAWDRYHDVECRVAARIMPPGQLTLDTVYQLLTIKETVCGIREANGIGRLKAAIRQLDKAKGQCTRGFFKDNECKKVGFEALYTLCDNITQERLEIYIPKSVFILITLLKYTPLFGDDLKEEEFENIVKNEEILFVGALILKLYKINKLNCQTLPGHFAGACRKSKDTVQCHIQMCCQRGCGVVPINSLINHSCDPNVKNVVTSSQNFILYTLMPIKKNSQLFITYQQNFYDMIRYDRLTILQNGYNFLCDCPACLENWPTIKELLRMIQERPDVYRLMSSPKELSLLYIENELVRTILENPENAKPNQKTIQSLSKALAKAARQLKQPSVVLWKLKSSMHAVFEMLYIKT